MSTPTPFEIGRGIGANVGGAFRGAADTNVIDEILSQANASEDPQALNNAMNMILQRVSPERQQMPMQALQQRQQQLMQQNQARAYQEQGLSPYLPEGINKEILKGRKPKAGAKDPESIQQALDILKRQREILQTGHLGPKIGIIGTGRKFGSTTSPEGQALRSEYQRLGKALIQMSTNIPIRNKKEFEILAEDLYDPTLKQEEIKGILDAMERIIQGSIGETDANISAKEPQQNGKRPPLSSFNR